MPVITLPDGSQRHYDHAVSPMDVALDIGPGLAKACIAGRVNGELVDASDVIDSDANLAIITAKDDEGPRKLSATPARTCWVTPLNSSGQPPKWLSVRLSTMVFTMTLTLTTR